MKSNVDEIVGAIIGNIILVAIIVWISGEAGCSYYKRVFGTHGLFGEKIYVSESKHRVVGNRNFDAHYGYVQRIKPSNPSVLFDWYYHYVMPTKKLVYGISGQKSFPYSYIKSGQKSFPYSYNEREMESYRESYRQAMEHYRRVKTFLEGKYKLVEFKSEDGCDRFELEKDAYGQHLHYYAEPNWCMLRIKNNSASKDELVCHGEFIVELIAVDYDLVSKLQKDINEYYLDSL